MEEKCKHFSYLHIVQQNLLEFETLLIYWASTNTSYSCIRADPPHGVQLKTNQNKQRNTNNKQKQPIKIQLIPFSAKNLRIWLKSRKTLYVKLWQDKTCTSWNNLQTLNKVFLKGLLLIFQHLITSSEFNLIPIGITSYT